MALLLFLLFTVGGLAFVAGATTGWRGQVSDREMGYLVPARVAADPVLRRQADALLVRWGTVGAVLSAGPVVLLAVRGLRDAGALPLWQLVALAAYGFLLALVAGYPFERIERLGADR